MASRETNRENKKGDKQNGIIIVLTVAVLLLFVSWLFAFGGIIQLTQAASQTFFPSLASTPVNQSYRFITYQNPQWGFSLQYPVGFIAEEPTAETTSSFRAYASIANKPPELIEVIADNSTSANALFQDLLATSSEEGHTITRAFTTTSGKLANLIITTTLLPIVPDISNERATIYQAVYQCSDPENNAYTSLLLITIPESLQQDNAVAEHVVNSYAC